LDFISLEFADKDRHEQTVKSKWTQNVAKISTSINTVLGCTDEKKRKKRKTE
jgi:hypothetical protein